jgi:hypothetical protein
MKVGRMNADGGARKCNFVGVRFCLDLPLLQSSSPEMSWDRQPIQELLPLCTLRRATPLSLSSQS